MRKSLWKPLAQDSIANLSRFLPYVARRLAETAGAGLAQYLAVKSCLGMPRGVDDAEKLYQVFVRANPIADRVTEPWQNEAANVMKPRPPSGRVLHDKLKGSFRFVEELAAVVATLLLKVSRRFDQISLD